MAKIVHSAAETRKRVSETNEIDYVKSKKAAKVGNIKLTTGNREKKSISDSKNLGGSSVIYLGHIAHGFYEAEMRKFFSQFGKVLKLKLFRSKKSGKSKGYAFIEFEDEEVATIVAEAMHGYFLHERQLICHVVPFSKIHAVL